MFKFIKAVSDTVLYMINATCYNKPLIFIGATFQKKLISHHQAVNKADSCLHMRCAGSESMAQAQESHFIGRLVGVKLPKTAYHVSEQQKCRLQSAEIGRPL